jgi:hypothetical protein
MQVSENLVDDLLRIMKAEGLQIDEKEDRLRQLMTGTIFACLCTSSVFSSSFCI